MMIFSSVDSEFDTKEEAIKDLSEFLFLCYKTEFEYMSRMKNDACSENHLTLKTPYCPECGANLSVTLPTREGFEQWVSDLPALELHQWHPDEGDEGYWQVYPREGYPIEVVAMEEGEKLISGLAAKAFPDDADWDAF